MKIAIIDYGAGNIQSIKFAIKRLGYDAVLTDDAAEIKAADKVIFPGVGEASSAMKMLKSTGLDTVIPKLTQPVLGICLGMQLMCEYCEEGDTTGLSIFDAKVVRFDNSVKVPQIGWNQIYDLQSDLFEGVNEKEYVYLVHSFYVKECEETICSTEYGVEYTSAIKKNNFYGVQFHPEKSSKAGEKILENFLKLELPS
ncbi:imidazole glycerol phosphate synthase subunit HisH [Zunongwangia profunda]|uniref:Imidazole glycerol phosphate synthase subunit HisH n=1 Tax=Zunongwangia profunda (strain DSM 18752 / CCTCC AB 206139 / SM-A87) TaxID=655815 RepID=D5BD34_ZUNPS|nr:imidazole glycerol phosphate synthase subunit HisH [Zunongwangia profunda]ADF52714.1 imidazole glycerol phosphate synthase subunit HisH [Zunongwangia profunda SM-A87]MAC64562.1 imidazole glycerol phosphate synthase subunit HisH [Flavobacteriaceae bacterium]MAS72697.1 imidazole glycerol phosphate synthase subunit HisH [Zunongwangia sp.]|tara:strand:- start:333 stop:926 length:594 start_codon:yes stop_codon:yes gene_type:complete